MSSVAPVEVPEVLVVGGGVELRSLLAHVGIQAVEGFDTPGDRPVRCLLLDVRATDLDVRALLARLVTPIGLPRFPVVVIGARADRARWFAAGAQECLDEGELDPPRIARAVDDAIARWECGRAAAEERLIAERALRASEERLHLALAAAGACAWSLSLTTGTLECSPDMLERYGVEPKTLTAASFQDRIPPEDRARATLAFEDALAGRTADFRTELRLRHGGDHNHLQVVGRVVRDASGEPIRLHGVSLDVTVHKALEEALVRADLNKDRFLATLSHELRNGLAPLSMGLGLLESCEDPEWVEVQLRMERQLKHVVRLVDDLLDLARVRQGKVSLDHQQVALCTAVQDGIEASRPLLENGRHHLAIRLPGEPVWVRGDATRLAQVVSNLLNNAAKYTPSGGRIEISVDVETDWARIVVTDDGAGLEAGQLRQVFELFGQAEHTRPRSQGGLGIGLTLVRHLVELHGGTVEVSSPGLGLGCTFVVCLPRAPVPVAGRRVLVVDDSVDIADMLALLLRTSGHAVRVAHDGEEALREADAFVPDVVFLDLGLPGTPGEEVARQLRAARSTPFLLVALTGQGSDEDRRRTAEAGFDLHLTKPADAELLLRIVETG